MRKRELQTIPLKLAELKEYDIAKMERAAARNQSKTFSTSTQDPSPSPLADVGPKTKKEVQQRLNTTM